MAANSLTPLPRYLHATLDKHTGIVHVATYAKGAAKYVLTGGADRIIRLWNPSTATEIKAYKGHGYEVLSIAVFVELFHSLLYNDCEREMDSHS